VNLFIVFQTPQNWVATERIGFKLVSILDVRQQALFGLCEFRKELSIAKFPKPKPWAASIVTRWPT
jgi:hypothetical protein